MNTRHYHNGLKTTVLLSGMWALLLAIGYAIALGTRQSMWIFIFAGIGLIQIVWSYWNSATMALRSMNAYQVTEAQQPAMYRIVRELSQKAGQPMPTLWVAPTMTPNAFATGRNPSHAAVCCTEGILQLLDEREMRGVLGHELMHVYNRDILTSSVAAGIASIIGTIAQILSFGAMFGGSNRDGERSNPIAMFVIAMLAPIATQVIQMAISRTREFDADEDGARLTGDPLALASALNKLESGVSMYPMDPNNRNTEAASAMMIANPFGSLKNMLSTHPPMDQRIARLQQQAREMGQY